MRRRVLDDLLSRLRPADVLVIWKLDRLERSLHHLVTLTHDLMERQIGLISLHDPIDTTTPQGRLVFNIFAALAEFERDLSASAPKLVSRPPRGLSKQAKATALAAETLYQAGQLSVQEICAQLHITKPTLYTYLKQLGVKTGARQRQGAKTA